MANSEKLFGLDFTSYPELVEVSKDLENLEVLYHLYAEQRDARSNWSSTLWVNLNPQQLVDGIDDYIRTFKALPKHVRAADIAKHVEEKMKEFKRSVPLFVDLKHEALRPRHWNMLMDKTGVHFEMAPDRFTLGKLFAMELHQYSEVIADIIATAIKELQVEKTVKDLTEVFVIIIVSFVNGFVLMFLKCHGTFNDIKLILINIKTSCLFIWIYFSDVGQLQADSNQIF